MVEDDLVDTIPSTLKEASNRCREEEEEEGNRDKREEKRVGNENELRRRGRQKQTAELAGDQQETKGGRWRDHRSD